MYMYTFTGSTIPQNKQLEPFLYILRMSIYPRYSKATLVHGMHLFLNENIIEPL